MAEPNPFLNAMAIELVAEKVVSFLPLQDVKALTRASTRTRNAVRKTKEFSSRVRLHISQLAVRVGLLTLEDLFLPKHIFLEIFNYLTFEESNTIVEMLGVAETLDLTFPSSAELKNIPFTHSLRKVLATTPTLRSLSLEAAMLNEINPDLFSEPEIQGLFSRLQCLAILVTRTASLGYAQYAFQENLLRIGRMPLNLASFRFARVTQIAGFETEHVKYVPNIVGAARNTLEELELTDLRIWFLKGMSAISCPRLRRLTLSTLGVDGSETIVQQFLQNQPPLLELDMTLSLSFPQSILETIQAKSWRLKKLHLKSKAFHALVGPMKTQFLEGMTELKDFSLIQPYGPLQRCNCFSCEGNGEVVMGQLPPKKLENISLQGFYFESGRRVPVEKSELLLPRFGNLTELNLYRSLDAITDDVLQSIISGCRKLTYFAFSNSNVGNFGLTGVRDGEEEKTGASLDDLKGLIHLKMMACPDISPNVLLRVLKFEHLRSFHLQNKVPVRKGFLLALARQNRCLETITVNMAKFIRTDKMSALWEEMDKANPRVSQLNLQDYAESWDVDEQLSLRFRDRKSLDQYFIRDGHGVDGQ